jgi:hypothetical protein
MIEDSSEIHRRAAEDAAAGAEIFPFSALTQRSLRLGGERTVPCKLIRFHYHYFIIATFSDY